MKNEGTKPNSVLLRPRVVPFRFSKMKNARMLGRSQWGRQYTQNGKVLALWVKVRASVATPLTPAQASGRLVSATFLLLDYLMRSQGF